jgi:glyoxylate/hydroxypyruvate reductase A
MLILSAGAGVDHILKHEPPQEVPMTRIVDPDLTGRMVEFVVLHCLYHLRRMNEAAENQRRELWTAPVFPPARNVTVGLMGVGEMGRACAEGLMALGFNVIGWGRSPRGGLPFAAFSGAGGLDAFLAQTDILVSTLPATPQTRGLIDTAVLKKLRRDGPFGAPVLINAGRGDTACEDDLLLALRDGTLRAASLDVFVTEPLPASSPFWGLANVVVTPHNAADSDPEALAAAVIAEIARFEAGLPLLNPVCAERGY